MPPDLEPEDENFALAILILHAKYFGPFPDMFFELLDDEGVAILHFVADQCGEETQVYAKAGSGKIDPDDKDFICYLMKPDPRDRPSAKEALTHPWLKNV